MVSARKSYLFSITINRVAFPGPVLTVELIYLEKLLYQVVMAELSPLCCASSPFLLKICRDVSLVYPSGATMESVPDSASGLQGYQPLVD